MVTDAVNDKRSNIRKELFSWWTELTKKEAAMKKLEFENWQVVYEGQRLQIMYKESLMAEVEEGRVFLHISIEEPYQLPLHLVKETVLIAE